MGWDKLQLTCAPGVPAELALGAHNPVVRPHPRGHPRLQKSVSGPQRVPSTPRLPAPPSLGCGCGGVGTGQGLGCTTRGGRGQQSDCSSWGDAWRPGDRRCPGALPFGELVIYESTEVFKLFFRLFTEGAT